MSWNNEINNWAIVPYTGSAIEEAPPLLKKEEPCSSIVPWKPPITMPFMKRPASVKKEKEEVKNIADAILRPSIFPEKVLSQKKAVNWNIDYQSLPKQGLGYPKGINFISLNNNRYIGSSDPNETVTFWKTIFDADCRIIIKLNDTPLRYIPRIGKICKMQKGMLISNNKEQEINTNIIKREVSLIEGESTKVVTHFQFSGWPDMSVPKREEFLNLIRAVKEEEQKLQEQQQGGVPLIAVHCTAGIGRTGTFLAIHSNLDNQQVNLFQTIGNLRAQRCNKMVETAQQLQFISKFLTYYQGLNHAS